MTFPQFIAAVDNLVAQWHHNDPTKGRVPREELKSIFVDVCEQAVHELAEMQRQRDEAIRQLHGHITKGTNHQ